MLRDKFEVTLKRKTIPERASEYRVAMPEMKFDEQRFRTHKLRLDEAMVSWETDEGTTNGYEITQLEYLEVRLLGDDE